jgi:hypothetical protein
MPEWIGVLAIEGQVTGDGRLLDAGSLYWETLPLPLIWDREDGDHTGMVVGSVDRIWRDGANIMGEGSLADSEDADTRAAVQRVRELINDGAVGVSVGLDSETMELRADPDLLPEDDDFLIAALGGSATLPVADRDRPWSGAAARNRVFAAATNNGGEPDISMLRKAFLWQDPNADPQTKEAWKLGVADIIDGRLTLIPRGVVATAGGRGVGAVNGLSDSDRNRIMSRICRLYDRVRETHSDFADCPFNVEMSTIDRRSHDDAVMAFTSARIRHVAIVDTPAVADARIAIVAAVAWIADHLESADIEAFADPHFGQSSHHDPRLVAQTPERPGEAVTYGAPLTVTEDGRIFGHAALWGRCHAGFRTRCVVPPRGAEYSRFLHGAAVPGIPTGPLTVGTTHAMWDDDAVEAFNHYADTGRAVADVAVGEDHLGLWVAGMLRPGVSERDLADLRGSSLSGDWRPVNGKYRLVGLLAVNQPGYLTQRASPDGGAVITAGPCACDSTDPIADLYDRVITAELAIAQLLSR